ncbi:MAG: tetratricopeptide repeat protein [Rhodospirillales bacterium]|nr:tetratricopeptide repeat protein [Rhodospirillales bacterium]
MGEAAELIAHGRRQLAAGQAMEAAAALASATEIEPVSADVFCDLAIAHHRAGDPARAVAACREALARAPDHAAANLNLACILRELDRLGEAVAHADRAERIALVTGDDALLADARFNRGLAKLGLGQVDAGWQDWDGRLAQPLWTRFDPARRWTGEPLHGRSLVVRREQGIGDELFFATCYPELLRRAGDGPVVIEADARFAPALSRALPGATLHAIDTVAGRAAAMAGRPAPAGAARAPQGDLWVAAGSLPGLVGLPDTAQPLLAPLPELRRRWIDRLAALPGAGPMVGLCWRSSQASARRDRFQAGIEQMAPLLRLDNIRCVSLQIGLAERERTLAGAPLHHFDDVDLANDLEQALALVSALDLVVSVGTWIVPLAGTVGTPAWYLSALRDFWTLGQDTIPWFRAMRVLPTAEGDFTASATEAAQAIAMGGWR